MKGRIFIVCIWTPRTCWRVREILDQPSVPSIRRKCRLVARCLADRNQRSVCWSENTNVVTATALFQQLVAAETIKKISILRIFSFLSITI